MTIRADCVDCACTVFNKVKEDDHGVLFACDDCGEELYVETKRVKTPAP